MAVTITGITPTAGTGIGPHPITMTGTGLPTTPNGSRLVMKDAGGAVVGQSGLGTATATTFTAAVTFEVFTPAGAYRCWLTEGVSAYIGPMFTLTRNAPTPPAGGTPAGFGEFDRSHGLPNWRR